MSYYIYHSEADGEAQIHFGGCPNCNHGLGPQEGLDPAKGEWFGPFSSFSSAEAAVVKTGRAVSDCEHCLL